MKELQQVELTRCSCLVLWCHGHGLCCGSARALKEQCESALYFFLRLNLCLMKQIWICHRLRRDERNLGVGKLGRH